YKMGWLAKEGFMGSKSQSTEGLPRLGAKYRGGSDSMLLQSRISSRPQTLKDLLAEDSLLRSMFEDSPYRQASKPHPLIASPMRVQQRPKKTPKAHTIPLKRATHPPRQLVEDGAAIMPAKKLVSSAKERPARLQPLFIGSTTIDWRSIDTRGARLSFNPLTRETKLVQTTSNLTQIKAKSRRSIFANPTNERPHQVVNIPTRTTGKQPIHSPPIKKGINSTQRVNKRSTFQPIGKQAIFDQRIEEQPIPTQPIPDCSPFTQPIGSKLCNKFPALKLQHAICDRSEDSGTTLAPLEAKSTSQPTTLELKSEGEAEINGLKTFEEDIGTGLEAIKLAKLSTEYQSPAISPISNTSTLLNTKRTTWRHSLLSIPHLFKKPKDPFWNSPAKASAHKLNRNWLARLIHRQSTPVLTS
ncbi:hypothetical protein L0F63_005497, partial [Massospora cicadina]